MCSSVVLNCMFVVFFSNIVYSYANCTYATNINQQVPVSHNRLSELLYKRYVVSVENYDFYIGICISAKIGAPKEVGVLQVSTDGSKSNSFVIGKIDNAAIKAGQNWVMLEYANGDKYRTHCNQEARKASMMFTCNKAVTGPPNIQVLEENTKKINDCYYLFELAHSSICTNPTPDSTLSIGSIIVISFCVIVALYMVIGFIIQRIRGAKGMDQIPNYGTWQECGNLIADGCDFIFRSRPKASNHFYPHMDGDSRQTLQPDDRHLIDEDEHDDHMLPM